MRRSSTDESTYRRSPSPEGKEPGFARGGPFRRYSSLYGRGDGGDGGGAGGPFGLHGSPGPKAGQARHPPPKGTKYVVFYLDLSFIFLLELKRCGMARGCLQGVKYLMFAFNLLFWVSGRARAGPGRRRSCRDPGRARPRPEGGRDARAADAGSPGSPLGWRPGLDLPVGRGLRGGGEPSRAAARGACPTRACPARCLGP